MKKIIRSVCLLSALVLTLLCLASCQSPTKYNTDNTGEGLNVNMAAVANAINSMKVSDFEPCEDDESDYVLIKVKNYGDIVVVMREDIAPKTVANFKNLVKSGFFSGTIFHRVIENFMIQGGGMIIKDDKMVQKQASTIGGEFTSNGFANNLDHVRGVIAMARTDIPDSASSQFYIVHNEASHLDGDYATFGYVLAGMDVVDAIATSAVVSSVPVEPIVIESVTFVQTK